MRRILVIGANGQVGSELVDALANLYGESSVIAADVVAPKRPHRVAFETLDVLDVARLCEITRRHAVNDVYHLAGLLSVSGEAAPLKAWSLNTNGLLNVLELARQGNIERLFWPSSIAAFGPHSMSVDTPQLTVMDPVTMYGITKEAGERLCEYYALRFRVDVRSLRYPGIVSYKTPPGGGTTDYAISIFRAAREHQAFRCFLGPASRLPMIYMADAVRATIELMAADPASLRVRSSYNLAGMSFTPAELAHEISGHVPGFRISYEPDYRQAIAESWPRTIDDSQARSDWGWRPRFDLQSLVVDMLANLPDVTDSRAA